jgi:hypothetical protein
LDDIEYDITQLYLSQKKQKIKLKQVRCALPDIIDKLDFITKAVQHLTPISQSLNKPVNNRMQSNYIFETLNLIESRREK